MKVFVRSIQEYGNLSDNLPLQKNREDERCVIKNIYVLLMQKIFIVRILLRSEFITDQFG